MESRWHIPAGKKLEDTKIEDRKHALHMTRDNWANITDHLSRNRMVIEAKEADEMKKRAMKNSSDAMTKDWDNSVENIRKRKEEARAMRLESNQDQTLVRYNELKKEQAAERQIYVDSMRHKLMQKKAFPAALNSALLLSEVMFERQKQIELEQKIKDHDREQTKQEVESMQRDVADFEAESIAKKQAEQKKNQDHMNLIKNQIDNNAAIRKKELEAKLAVDALEYDMAQREAMKIALAQKKQAFEDRQKIKSDLAESLRIYNNNKDQERREGEEIMEVIDIVSIGKKRMDCMMRTKENEIRRKRDLRADVVAKNIVAARSDTSDLEEASLQRAIAEQTAAAEARDKARQIKTERLKQERVQDYLDFNEAEKQRLHSEKEIEKFEMLNRFKTTEQNERYKQLRLEQLKKKNITYVEELKAQSIEEKRIKDTEEDEVKRMVQDVHEKCRADDEEFLMYAEKVYDHAKDRGRNTYPIEKVVAKYKSEVLKESRHEKQCAHYLANTLLNSTPGKMAHDPASDPNFRTSSCTCSCHREPLLH